MTPHPPSSSAPGPATHPPMTKSWKRKYRKLHRTFTQLSQRSDQLFQHNNKLSQILVRLSEGNEDLTSLIRRTGLGLIDEDVVSSLGKRKANGTNGVNGHAASGDEISSVEDSGEDTEDAEELMVENEAYDLLGAGRDEIELPEYVEEERNPMGVYEWLRRNQPQVFLQDMEGKKRKGEEEGELTFVSGEGKKKRGKGDGTGGKRKRAITMEGGEKKKPGPKRRKKSPGAA